MKTNLSKVEINQGMKNMIENNALAFATVNLKSEPHNIAVGFVKAISKNQLLITDNHIHESLENIKNNPNVSLVVWAREWEKHCIGYELCGKAKYYREGEFVERIKQIPENKGEPCKGAILVTLNKIKVLSC